MTGPLEQQLERQAARMGWTLRWYAEPLRAHPRLTTTKLDIYQGRRLLTADGPVWVIHGDDAAPRETIADAVLRIPGTRAMMRQAV